MSHWKIRDKKKANKTVLDLSGTVSSDVTIDGEKKVITMVFNRMGQLHDIAPRTLETADYIYPLFDDLHGRTIKAVGDYFTNII